MKRCITIALCFLILAKGYPQKIDTSKNFSKQASHDLHIQQYQANKKAGWLLFGAGMAMTAAGTYIYLLHALESDTRSPTDAGQILFFTGLTTTLISIPLFVAAGKHKKEAAVVLKGENAPTGGNFSGGTAYTALALRVRF